MCDTNSKAYHNAEQESFAKIQAEDEAALRHEIAEANLTEFLNEARAVGENLFRRAKLSPSSLPLPKYWICNYYGWCYEVDSISKEEEDALKTLNLRYSSVD
jgi:hypothetical protein